MQFDKKKSGWSSSWDCPMMLHFFYYIRIGHFNYRTHNAAHSPSHTQTNICVSPASCPARSIWIRWSPGSGWAARGSGPSPQKSANNSQEKHNENFCLTRSSETLSNFVIWLLGFSFLICSCFMFWVIATLKRNTDLFLLRRKSNLVCFHRGF